MSGYPHTPLLGLFSSLMVVLRVGDGPKEPRNSPYHLRRLACHYPPTGTSFCAKGPADLLFIPSSSKIQAKISTSGECGTAAGAGVLAPTQLGELVTGHVLTRTRVHSCSKSCTCGQQSGVVPAHPTSMTLTMLFCLTISLSGVLLIHLPISAQRPLPPGSLPETPLLLALCTLSCLGLLGLPLLMEL